MKTTRPITFPAGLLLALLALPAAAQTAAPGLATPSAVPVAAEGLRFNFRNAPLEQVLSYLSEAAGYTIVLDTPVHGTVDMWSAQPVAKDEVVTLLNFAINKNGYTATLEGRTLIVSSKDDAKKRGIPVRTGNDPLAIPANADLVIQIIPLRNIAAANAARDLATLLPGSANLVANEDSNSLVVTDTQINVRHVVELVAALDGSADAISGLKIYHLRNADPSEVAATLNSLFSGNSSNSSNRNQTQPNFGFMGGPAGMLNAFAAMRGGQGGGRGTNAGGGTGRSTTGSQGRSGGTMLAIPDARTNAVIVAAPKDSLAQVSDIIAQLDAGTARNQKVFVYTLENADVKQVETMLKNLFQNSNTRSTSSSTQADPLTTRESNNTQPTTSSVLSTGSSSGL